MKKTPARILSQRTPGNRNPEEPWHNGGDIEILEYARSLQKAAQKLIGKLDVERSVGTEWDACPVVLLYRQALEMDLKLLVGEGGGFLPSPADHITLYKTHSLRWLAQIVCQIIRKVGWESEFTCDGVGTLAEFTGLVNEVEIFDPVVRIVRSSRNPQLASNFYRTFDIVQFAMRLDAVLNLLDSTADALAAEWDQRGEAAAFLEISGGDDFGPTIQ